MSKIKAGIINVTGYAGVEWREYSRSTPRSKADFGHRTKCRRADASRDIPPSGKPQSDHNSRIRGCRFRLFGVTSQRECQRVPPVDSERYEGGGHQCRFLPSERPYCLPGLVRVYSPGAGITQAGGIRSSRNLSFPDYFRTISRQSRMFPHQRAFAAGPPIKAGIIEPEIIIDSKSGISGAGRTLTLSTHFSEVNEDVSAYALRRSPTSTRDHSGARPYSTRIKQ